MAKERNPSITIQFVSNTEVEEQKQSLDLHWDGVLAVPQTQQKHCIKPYGKHKLMVADTSDSTFSIVSIRPPDDEGEPDEEEEQDDEEEPSFFHAESFTVGMWVVVMYDGVKFPGEITAVGDDVEVKCIVVVRRIGNGQAL